jgi:hypothetical protein
VYVDAPLGIIVNELPEQIVPEFTVKIKDPLTVTVVIALPKHPAALVPEIVYVVFEVGVTIAEPLEYV